MHDHRHIVDVEASCGDVGRHEHGVGALAEACQHVDAQALLLVAVQSGSPHTDLEQLLGDALGAELGAGEHQGAALAGAELRGHGPLGRRLDREHVVIHRGHGGGHRGRLVAHRVHQEAVDDLLDLAVERGGEQHLLGAHRDGGEDVAHIGQEAEVGHVVRLVDDRALDEVELEGTALGEIDQAPRGRDDDPDAAVDGVGLLLDVHPAGDELRLHADCAGEGVDRVDDLDGELARGDQHDAQGALAVHLAAPEARGHRQGEGEGLARAGLCACQDVASCQGIRQDR